MAMPAWVPELGVAAQVVIAIAAIWGERIRATLSRPRLELKLVAGAGDAEPRNLPDLGLATVRYHRLEVRNRRRLSIANGVQVFITQIELREPSGRIRTDFTGAVPLEWQHRELYPTARDVGHAPLGANLLFIYSDFIQLTAMVEPVPIAFGDRRTGAQNFWITVLARGLNGCGSSCDGTGNGSQETPKWPAIFR